MNTVVPLLLGTMSKGNVCVGVAVAPWKRMQNITHLQKMLLSASVMDLLQLHTAFLSHILFDSDENKGFTHLLMGTSAVSSTWLL